MDWGKKKVFVQQILSRRKASESVQNSKYSQSLQAQQRKEAGSKQFVG
jgi:hypothetical protein